MKQVIALSLITTLLAVGGNATADPVTYNVQADYTAGNFSASWLHSATACPSTGTVGATLFMCGGTPEKITGTIEGHLNGGHLQVTGGALNVGATDYGVLGGFMGPFANGAFWSLNIDTLGLFLFESFSMGSGMPNFFDGDTMILWGQNLGAYLQAGNNRLGIDLYATRVTVPEPGSLALLGLGLFGVAAARRRRVHATL